MRWQPSIQRVLIAYSKDTSKCEKWRYKQTSMNKGANTVSIVHQMYWAIHMNETLKSSLVSSSVHHNQALNAGFMFCWVYCCRDECMQTDSWLNHREAQGTVRQITTKFLISSYRETMCWQEWNGRQCQVDVCTREVTNVDHTNSHDDTLECTDVPASHLYGCHKMQY